MKGEKKVSSVYPELVRFFKNKDDADKYSIRSDARVTMKCPKCGHEHIMIVKNLTRRHYSCPVSGSKKSFPERLTMAILDSLGEKYLYQLNNKTFSWCGKYRYDFYLIEKGIIIETDGAQHKTNTFKFAGAKTLEETIENDKEKEKIANDNGVKVIRIDFSNRDILYVKSVIKDSLKDIIDTENIDWEACISKASGSLLVDVCNQWEKEKDFKTTADLSKIFNVSRDTILRLIHDGQKIGLCTYDTDKEKRRASKIGASISKRERTKSILVYDKNENFIGEYHGAKYLSSISKDIFGVKFDYEGIIYTCNGAQKSHRGYKFKYKDDNDKR